MITIKKFIAVSIVLSLLGIPTVSFAKARGGSGRGFSGGSHSEGSGSIGSRGSRTYEHNDAKPIEQSTTAKPAASHPTTANTAPTAPPIPASSPSWWQRNPIMVGLLSGIAGSWLGHLIFGASETTARTNQTGEQSGEAGQIAPSRSNGMLMILLILMGAGTLYFVFRGRRRAVPSFSGMSQASAASGSLSASSAALLSDQTVDTELTSADKAAFQQLLVNIQTSWSQQDLTALRRFVTPEMLGYFGTALAEQTSQGIANYVQDVVLLHAEQRECWLEGTTQYATVLLAWRARDYTVSLSKQPGEMGYLIEGSDVAPTETSEVWTFMRAQDGQWLLSAIQQVA